MTPIALIAAGAVSAQGTGRSAWSVGEVGEPAKSSIARDPELEELGFRKPYAARIAEIPAGAGDRAARLLGFAAGELVRALDERVRDWRSRRIALAIGTSGGGMPSMVESFALRAAGAAIPRELASRASYFGPLAMLRDALGVPLDPALQVLAACASSTVALGLGARWLEQELADLVIAGGYDALSPFIAAGFEVLGATSECSRPFRVERDGMALGEGAALVGLMRATDAPPEVLGYVCGFGASSDAVHVTAPDRQGRGLARAARAALEQAAAAGEVDIVSAHGTATSFNDAAESRAIELALGAAAERAVVHPFKAVVGHTLGTAGVLELLAALDALERGVLPAAAGSGPIAPELGARLLDRNASGTPQSVLKLSAAFGGANAALVATRSPAAGRAREPVQARVFAVGDPIDDRDLDLIRSVSQHDPSKLARLDPLSGLAVTAVARLLRKCGELPPETGVVVGSVACTIEIDELFDRRCRERGHRAAEPIRFPPTSPNLCAGQCSIAFALRGPSLTVSSGESAPLEALGAAIDLVRGGDAPAMIVVAADQVGEVVTEIWRAAGFAVPRHGALAAVVSRTGARPIDRPSARARPPTEPGWPALLHALAP